MKWIGGSEETELTMSILKERFVKVFLYKQLERNEKKESTYFVGSGRPTTYLQPVIPSAGR